MRSLVSVLVLSFILFSNSVFPQDVTPPNFASADKPAEHNSRSLTNVRSEDEEYLEALFAPDTVPLAGIPVLENALGDVVHDSVVNVIDLLRLRDIVIGRGSTATTYEQSESDIRRDGSIDSNDLNDLIDVILHLKNVPYLVGSTGGSVLGAGITMYFDSGEVAGNAIMRINKQSKNDIENTSGILFAALAPESTYFMTGFKVESTNENYIFPPRMDIKLNEFPPCQLQGSNVLMTARRGPTGNTELVLLTSLQLGADSTLLVPSPPIPNIGISIPEGNRVRLTANQYMPLEVMTILVTNLSNNLFGNQVIFSSTDGSSLAIRPVAFYPDTATSFENVRGLQVPVAPLLPGFCEVQVQHLGTTLISNSVSIEILPLQNPVTNNPDSLCSTFQVQYIKLLDSAYQMILHDDIPIDLKESLLRVVDFREEIDSLFSFILTRNELSDLRKKYAAVIENDHLLERINSAIISNNYNHDYTTLSHYVNNVFLPGALREQINIIDPLIFVYGTTDLIISCSIALVDPEPVSKTYETIKCIADAGIAGYEFYKLIKSGGTFNEYEKFYSPFLNSIRTLDSKFVLEGIFSSDPSFDPKKYPGFCMNIWKHNTNAAGSVGDDSGGDDGCPGDCCSGSGGGSPPSCPPGFGGSIAAISNPNILGGQNHEIPELPKKFVSPLKDAIVRPTNGGISGIVGIVDGAGSFAIPGLHPGDTIHFSIYDPHRGLFDPDAGYGVSPNVAEQGVYFPTFLYFNPPSDIIWYGIDIAEVKSDSLALNRQRIDYSMYVSPSDTGKLLNLGFRATSTLSLKLEDPQGNLLIDNTNTNCYVETNLKLSQVGTYKIRVAFGTSTLPGTFTVGVNYAPYPPIPYLCGTIPYDSLYSSYLYLSADTASVSANDTVTVQTGSTINFQQGGSITGYGALRGTASPQNPIVLKLYTGAIQQKSMSLQAVKPKTEVVEGGEKK